MEDNKHIDELNAEEKHLRALLQMSRQRSRASKPDVDQAWDDFLQKKHEAKPSQCGRFSFWHMAAAALVGAAAMWIAVYFFPSAFPFLDETDRFSTFVALQYDQSPQQIRLEEEDAAVNLTADDSISFRNVPAPAVVAQAPVCEVKTKRLSTPRGMDFKVILPDGSEVWLNAESTIEFPTAFHDGLRQVRLQGEAYFKVAHDERSPFIVTSEQMNVRVLGTSFNFRNYASEKAHVTLVEGKVEVMHPESTTPDATLEPGEEAWFDEEGTLRVEEADTYAVTQWVKGFFYFPDDPLVDVLRELGRWYNYGVVFRNMDAIHQHVHFSALRNESIEMAIESLNRLRHVYVQIEGDNIVVY